MKKIIPLLLLLFSTYIFAQDEASNWYFGFGAGIQFNAGTVTSLDNGALSTNEGSATISDSNGNLLFYTDGSTVYNSQHNVMVNGTGLFGDPSSTQSALIVPKPLDDNIYYIFTVDTTIGSDPDFGFNYSEVDMSLDGGLGEVTVKNINLIQNSSEKLSAVLKDCEDESVWVITYSSADGFSSDNNTFYAFEVTNAGVNTTPVTTPVNTSNSQRGYLKFSPDGTKMASANMSPGGLFLYDFDTSTGIVSNPLQLFINSVSNRPYGVEFSPNSQLLYIHSSNDFFSQTPSENNNPDNHTSTLTQFNLNAPNIQTSEFVIDQRSLYRGGLQLGPDGKIYRALSATYNSGLPFLGVINNPNEIGAACDYQHNAISLAPNNSSQGLPPFIQSFFNESVDIIQNNVSTTELSLCEGETYMLSYDDLPGAIYMWYKDGVLLAESDFDLEVTENGFYELVVELASGNCDNLEGEATVTYFEVPVANPVNTISICDDNNDSTFLFDFNAEVDLQVLGTQDPSTYIVKYYESFDDANNNINEIIMPYSNSSNPQEIYYRIENIGYNGCFDTGSFIIELFDTPIANAINDIELCDDELDGDQQNGQVTSDLQLLNDLILNGQDSNLFTVSYHSSQADADSSANALPSMYYNTTPYLEEIFVRVENNLNSNCYDTNSFNIIVNDLPVANQPNDIQVCDDDNDGFFSFNFNDLFDNDVLSGQNPSLFTVHYFNSQNDADNNTNELIMPYQTTTNPQTIFIRIHNINNIDCYDTTSFMLEVFNTPTANPLGDIEVCDDNADGDAMNGQVITNLEDLNPIVLGSQNSSDYSITYHISQSDADNGMNQLPLNYYNSLPNEQIFARIENILNTNCFSTTSFNLIVNSIPEAFDVSLFQCDEDGTFDGFTLFNLTESHEELTGGALDRTTKFYLTSSDAVNDVSEIDGNSFNNTSNPQTVYVRVINDITGCINFAELDLELSATSATDAALSTCDNDGVEDGLTEFDLSSVDADVILGITLDVDVTYYESYNDALLEVNPLPTLFTNTIPYNQTLFVRVENDNACYGINQVELTVHPLPNLDEDIEFIYCLNTFPETITIDAGILGDDINNYSYSWSTNEDTYSIEINEPGVYSVAVTNLNTLCSKTRTVTVVPSNIATIESIEVVDATSNNTITVFVSGQGNYEFALDNELGPYQDSNFFEDVPPGLHTIYIRDKNECGIVEDIVSVIGFPKFFTPNNDSYNDTWQVYGVNTPEQFSSKIYIYDRYGKLIKQLNPQGPGWDGTFNGYPMPTNDYWFHVVLQDGREFRSHFTLKR